MKKVKVVITKGIYKLIGGDQSKLIPVMEKFYSKNWGEIPEDDKLKNDISFLNHGSIIAKYMLNDVFIYAIKEAYSDKVTVMLPSEY